VAACPCDLRDLRPRRRPDLRLRLLDSLRIGGAYSGTLDELRIANAPIGDEEAALSRYCPAAGVDL
jgi:hypothetical protein